MLNSVMHHTRAAIDGMVFPTGLTFDGINQVPNLQAHVTAPYGTVVSDGPHAFVWGGDMRNKRETMGGPRAAQINLTSPFRTINHRVDITLRYALPIKLLTIDSVFPAIIDSIIEKLSGIQMPIAITDPLTGRPSTIVIIGEEFDTSYGQIYQITDGRYGLFGAKIVMPVRESIQQ